MKKKLVFLIAAMLILTMGLITGCGNDEESADDGSWKYIEDNGEMIVGLDDTFAPMGFRDKNDKLVGFDIDLAKAVGKEIGVKIKFKPIDWDAKEMELESKTIDCIWNGMSATEERMESMSLSKKYLNNKIVVMTMKKDLNVASVDDLKDMKIGTQILESIGFPEELVINSSEERLKAYFEERKGRNIFEDLMCL